MPILCNVIAGLSFNLICHQSIRELDNTSLRDGGSVFQTDLPFISSYVYCAKHLCLIVDLAFGRFAIYYIVSLSVSRSSVLSLIPSGISTVTPSVRLSSIPFVDPSGSSSVIPSLLPSIPVRDISQNGTHLTWQRHLLWW